MNPRAALDTNSAPRGGVLYPPLCPDKIGIRLANFNTLRF